MARRICALIFAVLVTFVLCIDPGVATVVDVTDVREPVETETAVRYGFTTPSLAGSGADTARFTAQLPNIPHLSLSTGPVWRLLFGFRTSVAASDTAKVELWFGRNETEGVLYRTHILDSSVVVANIPEVLDDTTVCLSTDRWIQFDMTNVDADAAVFSGDLTVLKGKR